ncbi:MAG: undecaprenyl-diphosphate phosphatase [Oscillospiraceae bacterium]
MNEYRRMIIMLLVSTMPLFVLLPFKKYYDSLIEIGNMGFLGLCFLITSVLLWLSDKCVKGKTNAKNMTYKNALTIGIAQGVAILPGISRSGSTVATSLLCGLSKRYAVQFSFILGIPAILGGGLIEIKDSIKSGISIEIMPIIVAFLVSALTGLFAIKFISYIIKSDKFKYFAYYTMAIGVFAVGVGIYDIFF